MVKEKCIAANVAPTEQQIIHYDTNVLNDTINITESLFFTSHNLFTAVYPSVNETVY